MHQRNLRVKTEREITLSSERLAMRSSSAGISFFELLNIDAIESSGLVAENDNALTGEPEHNHP